MCRTLFRFVLVGYSSFFQHLCYVSSCMLRLFYHTITHCCFQCCQFNGSIYECQLLLFLTNWISNKPKTCRLPIVKIIYFHAAKPLQLARCHYGRLPIGSKTSTKTTCGIIVEHVTIVDEIPTVVQFNCKRNTRRPQLWTFAKASFGPTL